jgi:hypothetical protein
MLTLFLYSCVEVDCRDGVILVFYCSFVYNLAIKAVESTVLARSFLMIKR